MTWSLSASAQPGDEGSVSSPSAQGEEYASVSPESTQAESSSEVASAPEEPRTRTRRGEVFSDLYIGAAITTDATIKVDGVVQEESLLCGAECSSTKAPVGGLRIGWFVGRFQWLGVAGDFSVFVQSWGIQSPGDSPHPPNRTATTPTLTIIPIHRARTRQAMASPYTGCSSRHGHGRSPGPVAQLRKAMRPHQT